jgi:hypothetical protein
MRQSMQVGDCAVEVTNPRPGLPPENRTWWQAAILIVLGLFGLLLVLGATGAAPFLYTLW